MSNIGLPEILMILIVALLVFGPRKLPEMGKSIGQALREFRGHTDAASAELRGLVDVQPVTVQPVTVQPVTVQPVTVQPATVSPATLAGEQPALVAERVPEAQG